MNKVLAAASYKGLVSLRNKGIPKDAKELRQRIDAYFDVCAESESPVGVESLSFALGCDRATFWRWCSGQGGKDREWIELCKGARQTVLCFLEDAILRGNIMPATGIFLLKNYGYSDTKDFDESLGSFEIPDITNYRTLSELPDFSRTEEQT